MRELRKAGKLQAVGIVQEQHADRARLYAQWRKLDWPILVDSLNLLEVSVVPIVLLLDEQGVVRSVLRNPKDDLAKALRMLEDAPRITPVDATPKRPYAAQLAGVRDLIYFEQPARYDEALVALERLVASDPTSGPLHFALGVAQRTRFDSDHRQEGDFQRAVHSWRRALDIDPNQYIWRRRIQQYGPPSEKPYPFYDWVDEARREIASRGEIPITLMADLTASELAQPRTTLGGETAVPPHPDPQGRITRDDELIETDITLVPPEPQPGESVHVYVSLRPNPQRDAHWNNESDPMTVYLDLPSGWSADKRLIAWPTPKGAVTDEHRTVEFDLQLPPDRSKMGEVRGIALYGVCRGATGECLYRRRDFVINFASSPQAP